MKIGFDAKRIFHNQTGLGNYSRDTVRILASFFPEHVYTLFNPKPGKIDRLTITDSMKIVHPTSFIWKKFSSIWRQKPIVKDLLSNDIEIYHGLTNELPRGIEKTNIKTVVTIHDLIFVRYPKLYSKIDQKIHFNKFKYAANVADVVIAISEQTKRDIVEFLGVSKEKVKVIYQGCHQAFKQDYSEKELELVKEKYKLPERYILNVGTIEERKNVLTLLKSVRDLDVSVVVVGRETKYAERVKYYIEKHKMEDRVFFLKGVDMQELAMIYKMASLFVYPSIFEGFGIPIIEALYSKTPVISSTGSCFAEAGGPFSMYVNPTDSKGFRDRISLVLENEELQKNMIEKGWEYVQQFNDKAIATKMVNLYKSL